MTLQFDATPDELKLFLDEAEEHLQTLDEGLLRLEREGDDPETLQAIFRAAHTLKGSSGAIGHTKMLRLTHTMENVLDQLRNGRLAVSSPLIDALLQSLDTLRLLNHQVRTLEDTGIDILPTIALLEAISSGRGAPAAAERAAPSAPAAPRWELSAEEEQALHAAMTAGGQAYAIALAIDTSSGLQAARALQVLLELGDIGHVVHAEPNQEAIEQQQVGDRLRVLAVTQWEEPLIRGLLSHIGDVSEITITAYQPGAAATPAAVAPVAMAAPAAAPARAASAPLPPAGFAPAAPAAATAVADPPADRRPAAAPPPQPTKTVRMDVARLDRLMNLVGELVIDRTRLLQLGASLEQRYADDPFVDQLAEASLHVGRITDQLQEEIMKGRMLPIESVLNKFPRLVRDLAAKMNKKVNLVISGQETELDRSVLEAISDPLIHLVRNAVDHGLETPEERVAAGKPPEGELLLAAQHAENQILITIRDDGRGIDPDTIKAAAVRKGIITTETAERLSPADAIDLIFTPGFSTAAQLSDISGRGVGMDIVRTNIEKLNGSIQVTSTVGRGTTFAMRLPLTLAIIQALLVQVQRQTYAIPIAAVVETVRIGAAAIQTIQRQEAILLREQILPLLRLDTYFDPDGAPPDRSTGLFVVAVRSGDGQVGMVVDRLIGEQEIVIKPLGRFIGDVPGLSGATILGDGGVALILDIPNLVKHAVGARRGG
jgi:two-component system chemotaxis sensor kinase CheA